MGTKFEINKIYSVQSDNYYFGETCGEFKEYIYIDYKCVKRTNKTVSFNFSHGCLSKNITYRIKLDDQGNEYVYMKERSEILTSNN